MAEQATILPITLLIVLALATNPAKGAACSDGIGTCGANDCDPRCKAKHGPKAQGSCDRTFVPGLCTCFFPCSPLPNPPSPGPRMCNGGAGPCSARCPAACCNHNCANKYPGGTGFCNMLGRTFLCQCRYPC